MAFTDRLEMSQQSLTSFIVAVSVACMCFFRTTRHWGTTKSMRTFTLRTFFDLPSAKRKGCVFLPTELFRPTTKLQTRMCREFWVRSDTGLPKPEVYRSLYRLLRLKYRMQDCKPYSNLLLFARMHRRSVFRVLWK